MTAGLLYSIGGSQSETVSQLFSLSLTAENSSATPR